VRSRPAVLLWSGLDKGKGSSVILICAVSDGKNLDLANSFAARASGLDLPCQIMDLTKALLPLYCSAAEAQGLPAQLTELKNRFAQASGMVFCAPEYNGSIPPVLSNVIAWLSVSGKDFRALFNAKPIGLATHSGSMGQKVLTAMRIQFSHLGANVVGREILTNSKKSLSLDSVDSILQQIDRLSI
jgi:chromate reductase, NAD(P)H dehydrogenase (quinone)